MIPGGGGGGGDSGVVYFCLGQPQTLFCEIPKQNSPITRLEWRIDLESSSSVESMTRLFTSADPEGHILRESRPGVKFIFNPTLNGSSSLVSVMNLTVNNINAIVTALINNATVNCGSEASQKTLYVIEGN